MLRAFAMRIAVGAVASLLALGVIYWTRFARNTAVADYTVRQKKSLVEYREKLTTHLLKPGPAPHAAEAEFTTSLENCRAVPYPSGDNLLYGFLTLPPGEGPHPAVVFCHGGFAVDESDARNAEAFRQAGFAVFAPAWRGENGNLGSYELYYGEAADAVNAMEFLASRDDIDPESIFVAGHSIGATVAALAAELSTRPRGAAAVGGMLDMHTYHQKHVEKIFDEIPFHWHLGEETLPRSPGLFLADLSCPLQLYYGDDEFPDSVDQAKAIAEAAAAHGKQVEYVELPGTDHFTSLAPALAQAAQFFRSLLDKPRQTPAPPRGDGGESAYLAMLFDRLPAVSVPSWTGGPREQERDWSLKPDPGPPDDLTKLYDLTEQFQVSGMAIAGPQRWWNYAFSDDATVVRDLFQRKAHRVVGRRPNHANAAREGESRFEGISPNGRLLTWRVEASNDPDAQRERWIAVHRTVDLGLVRVIPRAQMCQFVADDRVLVSHPAFQGSLAEYHATRLDHRLSHALRLVDLRTGAETNEIPVRAGGIWELTPGKRWLVISQPAESASESLKAPDAGKFDGAPSATELSVYDTATGKLASHSVFTGVPSGRAMRLSDDGRELAVVTESAIGVWDFAAGTVAVSSPLAESETSNNPKVRWLDDGKWLLVHDRHMIRRSDGMRRGHLHREGKSSGALTWAGNRFRDSANTAFVEFPFDDMEADLAKVPDPMSNLIAERKATLTIQAGTNTHLNEKELKTVRKYLVAAMAKRFRLAVVENGDRAGLQIRLTYSEGSSSLPIRNDKFYLDLKKLPERTPALALIGDRQTVACGLEVEIATPDGRTIWKGSAAGSAPVSYFDARASIVAQTRAVALREACSKLTADLPYYIPREANETAFPGPIALPDNPTTVAELAFPETSRPIDDSWLATDSGLPAVGVRLALWGMDEGKSAGRFYLHLPTIDGRPTLVYRDANGPTRIQPVEAEAAFTAVDLGKARMEFSPAGALLASIQGDVLSFRTAAEALEGEPSHDVKFSARIASFAWSPSARSIAISVPRQGIRIYDVEQLRACQTAEEATPLASLAEAGVATQMAFSADEKLLAADDLGKVVRLWSLDAGTVAFEFKAPAAGFRQRSTDVRSLALTPDATRLYVLSGDEIIELDTTKTAEPRRWTNKHAQGLKISPDGKTLAASLSTLAVQLIAVDGSSPPRYLQIETPRQTVTENARVEVAWSADGRLLAACDSDGLITVWDAEP